MSNDFKLQILSPDNIAFEGSISSVQVPAALGLMKIYPNHSAFVSSLLPGYITVYHVSGKEEVYFTNDGYVEIENNQVSLIVDDIIEATHIDKSYLQNKVELIKSKLNVDHEDSAYEKLTHSLALYQQYIQFN